MNSIANSLKKFVFCKKSQHTCSVLQRAAFKSRYSLDRIYPQSSLDITTYPKPPENEDGTFSGVIPIDELTLTYSASSGPGGQNVNKVNTKVDMRFHVTSAKWIPEAIKPKLLQKYSPMISKDGFLIIKSDRTRHQALNVADCLDKLRFMVREADKGPVEPTPDDLAVQLARHEKSTRERLREKRVRSDIKRGRRDE